MASANPYSVIAGSEASAIATSWLRTALADGVAVPNLSLPSADSEAAGGPEIFVPARANDAPGGARRGTTLDLEGESMDHCLSCGEFAPLGGGELVHLPWCVFTPRLTYEEL